MGVTPQGRPAPASAPELLPRKEYLRIYLYELADKGHLTRDEADAIVDAGGPVPASVPTGPALFVTAYLPMIPPLG